MKKNNKTFIILSPGFPVNKEDTTCLPTQQLFVRCLNKEFPSIDVIVLAFQYPYVSSTYQWYHNKVLAFNGRNKGKASRLIVWLRVWLSLRKINKTHNIIGIFSFWCTECALVGSYFSKFYGLTHHCWILGQDAKVENRFVRFIRPQPAELVAISPFLANEFLKNHKIQPDHIIPNGVEPTLYSGSPVERDIDILGAGSLIPLKQYDLFISIIKELTLYVPRLKALVCGKGPEEEKLRTMISKLHLEKNITLAGEKPHYEILHLMQRSKILLHTSSFEGFSTVCLEALYAGAHVVSFCNPVSEKIKHWHIVNNREQLLSKIRSILLTPDIGHEPVLVYSMEANTRAVMKLFGY